MLLTKRIQNLLLFFVLAILLIGACQNKEKELKKNSDITFDERMDWWRDARFGMFIHWGLYAIPAGEWKGSTNHAEWIRTTAQIPLEEYNQFVSQFNPQKFNAEQWVLAAKDAGMKYIVITSKHHDGFCLWDSEYTEYDVMATPFQRDILQELVVACQNHGIKLCFYHSIMDWHHPDYLPRRDWEKHRPVGDAQYDNYVHYMKNQLRELTNQYGDIGVMWFDGEWEKTWTHEMGLDLYQYVRELKPDIIVNNRVDKGRQGMEGMTKSSEYAGDFGTPEQEIPEQGDHVMDWESCMTMNNHWGFNHADDNWKSTKTLLHNLTDIVAKGGNFLLNIGPKADGTFPEASTVRLKEIGDWMQVHQESIYDTERIKLYAQGDSIRYVKKKDQDLYYVFISQQVDQNLILKSIEPKANSQIILMAENRAIPYEFDPELGVSITNIDLINQSKSLIKVLRIEGKEAKVLETPVIQIADQPMRDKYIFYENQTFTISTPDSPVVLKYTLDGADPTHFGVIYNGPVLIRQSCTVSVIAQQSEQISSQIGMTRFTKSNRVKSIEFSEPPHEKYQAIGSMSLADGENGSNQFSDGKWLGFEGTDMNATVDLGITKTIKNIKTNFLQNQGSWILFPVKLQYSISDNGKDYTLIKEFDNAISQDPGVSVKTYEYNGDPVQARYLKIFAQQSPICPKWHPAAGSPCWIFADEITID